MASAVDYGKHGDSLSLDGKVDEHGIQREVVNPLVDIPDPDAGLSEEERAAAVRLEPRFQSRAALLTALRTRSSFASSTSNSSHGCPSSTLSVILPFADVQWSSELTASSLSRSDKYWQRES
jgi:hypothetical protein